MDIKNHIQLKIFASSGYFINTFNSFIMSESFGYEPLKLPDFELISDDIGTIMGKTYFDLE